jgi:hypothetical protein
VSELVVVGNLNDARAAAEAAEAAGGAGGPLAAVARAVPQPVWDVSRRRGRAPVGLHAARGETLSL